MPKHTDIIPVSAELEFLPLQLRVPIKFGAETVRFISLARVKLEVRNARGDSAPGWGETPLSAAWVWPGPLGYEFREEVLKDFCRELCRAWSGGQAGGHPLEVGHDFQEKILPDLLAAFNAGRKEKMPWLAALVCCSAFDIALHDAYGMLHGVSIYSTYNASFMNRDLSAFLEPSAEKVSFAGLYPQDFLEPREDRLVAWHLVGGADPLSPDELTGTEPSDGYPVLLADWIRADGLKCLKIKLRGNDTTWDYERLVKIGGIAIVEDVHWLSTDFNCMVQEPHYVNAILDRLMREHPRIHGMILYVEQPFPYELEHHQVDVHSVSARKPLFMDESAHDWKMLRLGRALGWTGVALKTCKTQTSALLSLCWAKAHGMTLMVQDLTNPRLAQIPHLLLAAHAGTIMGVETNAPQFYPAASAVEAKIHPGIYTRRKGEVDLASIRGPGFGYRFQEVASAS